MELNTSAIEVAFLSKVQVSVCRPWDVFNRLVVLCSGQQIQCSSGLGGSVSMSVGSGITGSVSVKFENMEE